MDKTYRIGLFFVLVFIFSLTIIIQAQEDESPTGKIIYTVPTGVDGNTELYSFNVTDGSATLISPQDTQSDYHPIFSPDGGRIAFRSTIGTDTGILRFIAPDGTGVITTEITRVLQPAWSPDNSRVVFLTRNRFDHDINIYSVDSGELTTYDSPLIINIHATPTWSADGEFIFFTAYEQEGTNRDIYRISADFDESTLTNISNSPERSEASPSVSPNGLFISYKVETIGTSAGDVWVMDTTGENARNLSNGTLSLGSLETRHLWSPDSTRVMLNDAGRGIAVINVITGEIEESNGENPAWSPDGRWVAYTRFSSNRDGIAYSNVYIAPADTPAEGEIIIEDVLSSGLTWQPDPTLEFALPPTTTPTATATETPSASVESVLVQGQKGLWYFDGYANTDVVITLRSDEFDTYLQVYAQDSTLINENDDSDGTNSQIVSTLPKDDIYQIVVSSFYGDAGGAYTLIVTGIEGDLREKPQGGVFVQETTPTHTPTATPSPTATLRPTETFTPTATFTPTITPSPTFGFDRAQCPANLPPRLAVDSRGRVLPGDASIVYEQPLSDSAQLGEIPGGVSFTVLDGPVCTNNLIWWQVEYRDVTGWVVEGGNGEYFLEPLRR